MRSMMVFCGLRHVITGSQKSAASTLLPCRCAVLRSIFNDNIRGFFAYLNFLYTQLHTAALPLPRPNKVCILYNTDTSLRYFHGITVESRFCRICWQEYHGDPIPKPDTCFCRPLITPKDSRALCSLNRQSGGHLLWWDWSCPRLLTFQTTHTPGIWINSSCTEIHTPVMAASSSNESFFSPMVFCFYFGLCNTCYCSNMVSLYLPSNAPDEFQGSNLTRVWWSPLNLSSSAEERFATIYRNTGWLLADCWKRSPAALEVSAHPDRAENFLIHLDAADSLMMCANNSKGIHFSRSQTSPFYQIWVDIFFSSLPALQKPLRMELVPLNTSSPQFLAVLLPGHLCEQRNQSGLAGNHESVKQYPKQINFYVRLF